MTGKHSADGVEHLGETLRDVGRALSDWVECQLADQDITLSQWLALRYVADGRVATVGEIGRALRLSSGAATRLADGPERRKLLRRERDRSDRRMVRVVASDFGLAMASSARERLDTRWRQMFGDRDRFAELKVAEGLVFLRDELRRAIAPLESLTAGDPS